MKLTLSYTGGTSRGPQLASEFHSRGCLGQFFIPKAASRRIPEVVESPAVTRLRAFLAATARLRRAKPTERYLVNEFTDELVARRLQPGAEIMLAEAQIALKTIRKAKSFGMTTFLDRTNSHIRYQSRIWDEENLKMGIRWRVNSKPVIDRALNEYQETDYIVVLSSFVERTFLAEGVPKEKILKIRPGIDLRNFKSADCRDDVFRVIYCGVLQNKKGVHYLLEAWRRLKLPNAELFLIGTLDPYFEPTLRQYQGEFVRFQHVPNEFLHRWFQKGTVFALPSLEEGFPKVIIEAMACGLPVIATPNAAADDVVEEGVNGFMVPIRDSDALCDRILHLYNDRAKAQEMGKHAERKVRSEFTLEDYADRVLKALENGRRAVSSR